MKVCPHCRQPYRVERFGVPMPPLKARLVDLIKAAGELGTSSRELRQDLYRDHTHARSMTTVRLHIVQINDLLVSTDWRIVSDGRGRHARWRISLGKRRK